MAIIDDAFIQDMAALVIDIELKDDCQILRDTEGTLDSMGGSPHTYPVNSTVKSAVLNWNPPSQEYYIANQIVGMVTKKVHLPLGTTVLKNDRLVIKSVTYKVVEPIPDGSFDPVTQIIVVVTTLGV